MREDLFLEDVGDSPKSEHVECASNVDDEKSTVPLGIGFSDTAFENCGMAQQVYFVECRLLVLLSFLRLHATHVLTESTLKRRCNQLAGLYLYILFVLPALHSLLNS